MLQNNIKKSKNIYLTVFIIFIFAIFILVWLPSCDSKIKKYSIIYLDLDGTALDTTGIIRPETIRAVRDFQSRGGRVGIATGRTLEQAEKAIQTIVPNLPVVLFNGGVIAEVNVHNFKVLGNLDDETIRICASLLFDSPDIHGFIFHYPSTSIPDRDSETLNHFAHINNITFTFQKDIVNSSSDSLIKILIVCLKERTESVKEMIEGKIPKTSRIVISSPITIEVLPKTISKAVAIELIASDKAFSLEEVISFGDSGNDVEMLSRVGLGIAMSNGRPEAQTAADLIIGPNYSDAIAKFLLSPLIR